MSILGPTQDEFLAKLDESEAGREYLKVFRARNMGEERYVQAPHNAALYGTGEWQGKEINLALGVSGGVCYREHGVTVRPGQVRIEMTIKPNEDPASARARFGTYARFLATHSERLGRLSEFSGEPSEPKIPEPPKKQSNPSW